MTILPPPTGQAPHVCDIPLDNPFNELGPAYPLGALWECPDCGRWWKYREQYQDAADKWAPHYAWSPVSTWDIPARRRIAAHETEKMHYRVPTTAMSTFHWWDCHPNPNRGRP